MSSDKRGLGGELSFRAGTHGKSGPTEEDAVRGHCFHLIGADHSTGARMYRYRCCDCGGEELRLTGFEMARIHGPFVDEPNATFLNDAERAMHPPRALEGENVERCKGPHYPGEPHA